jgi:hypothetical protein
VEPWDVRRGILHFANTNDIRQPQNFGFERLQSRLHLFDGLDFIFVGGIYVRPEASLVSGLVGRPDHTGIHEIYKGVTVYEP